MKKILFLAHSNNDIDHFLPLVYGLGKHEGFVPEFLFLRFEEEAVSNDLHRALFRTLKLKRFSISDRSEWKGAAGVLFRFMKKMFIKAGGESFSELLKRLKIYRALTKVLYIAADNVLRKYCRGCFPEESIYKMLDNIGPDMVVLDMQSIPSSPPYPDLRTYFSSVITKILKKRSVPVFMMTHGVAVRYIEDDNSLFNRAQSFRPDIFALSNEMEKNVTRGFAGDDVRTLILGDVRYDGEWVEVLESTAGDFYDIKKEDGKLVILYLVGNLRFLRDASYEAVLHNDIISLLERYDNAEIWIKMHPRVKSDIISDICPGDALLSRIKVFGNDVDTNALMPYADIYISTLSAVLFQAIMKGKPVIFYNKWNLRDGFNFRTIFDDTPCVFKAGSYGELAECVDRIIEEGRLPMDDANIFYKEALSGGVDIGESVIDRYVNEIKQRLGYDGQE